MDDEHGLISPALREWFDAELAHLPEPMALTAAMLAAHMGRKNGRQATAEVMRSWHRLIIHYRLAVAQSEKAFIEEARRQDWTWQRISEVLALPGPAAAEQRESQLADQIRRDHPSGSATPYTG